VVGPPRWRAAEFARCARRGGTESEPQTDADVWAFSQRYVEFAKIHTRGWPGARRIKPGIIKGPSSRIVVFRDWRLDGRQVLLSHQLLTGAVDFQTWKWDLATLEALLGSLSDDERPPDGWFPERVGSPWAVLRYRVPSIPHKLPPFDVVQPILAQVLDAIGELDSWYVRCGRRILERPPAASIGEHLRSASLLARQSGDDTLAGQLDALHRGLTSRP